MTGSWSEFWCLNSSLAQLTQRSIQKVGVWLCSAEKRVVISSRQRDNAWVKIIPVAVFILLRWKSTFQVGGNMKAGKRGCCSPLLLRYFEIWSFQSWARLRGCIWGKQSLQPIFLVSHSILLSIMCGSLYFALESLKFKELPLVANRHCYKKKNWTL